MSEAPGLLTATRVWAIAALAFWLGFLLLRATRKPFAARTATLVLVALAVLALAEYRWQSLEHRAESAARVYLGNKPVNVSCVRPLGMLFAPNADGWVPFEEGKEPRTAYLATETCWNLRGFLKHPNAPSRAELAAAHTLVHEAVHLRGITDEAWTECIALQESYLIYTQLGADPETARALASRYATEIYPYLADTYHDGDCVPGGRLDEHPRTAEWPTG